jgi:hypothetical protein
MKNCFLKMLSAVVGLFAVACVNEDVEQVAGQQKRCGHVNINVLDADLVSKAASSTTAQEYEKVVRNVQVLVFDENDLLIYYHDAGTSVSNITLYVAEGRKDVWAVVNGPSLKSVSKKNQLTEYAVGLDAYNDLTGSKGFLMTGHAEVSVSALTPVTANIVAERLVSRVCLAKVTNGLPTAYPSLTVESVYLSNVVGNQNLSGTAAATVWYNKMGTSNGTQSKIIDGVTNMAELPSYTFEGTDKSLANGQVFAPGYRFYGFPNLVSKDVDGWSDPFTARMSRLVVTARIDGTLYYYPVILDQKMERNKTYDIDLTIAGLGSTSPYEEIVKGSIYTNITVKNWAGGDVYVESI